MKERAAKEHAEKEKQHTEASNKSASQCTNEQEISAQGGDGGDEVSTPFKFQKHIKEIATGPLKRKPNKKSQVDPLVLIEGDLDEISDKVHDTTSELWSHFEQ